MDAGARATQEQLPVGQTILGQTPRECSQITVQFACGSVQDNQIVMATLKYPHIFCLFQSFML
ncbi:hypothetical protein GZ77_18395 [Endozoicomonas montiporae]|uniref:Uncharacterized protein n=2 Tax=Endozoicomonas montiporae TaxID=1027273 RepID=A0A081N217_9GAMM|nr:hypothetical protein EZMO1_4652 [Endozoicomonas montiporae CL-33]KEQ12490.1 hypothetical protein GZ77_18395 [Endozoicomonas montiporae]